MPVSWPFTDHVNDAVTVAQTAVATVLTAAIWHRPLRPRLGSALMLGAVWLPALATVEPDFLRSMGVTLAVDHVVWTLTLSAALASIAILISQPGWLLVLALAGEAALYKLDAYIQQSDADLAGVHLAWTGLLIGAHIARTAKPERRKEPHRPGDGVHRSDDLALFVLSTAVAAVVSVFLLHRFPNSGDEWANTYQAQLFSHLKIYGVPPPCPAAFQNYWVFFHEGRTFTQYTPGWPLVMAPFALIKAPWLATPVVFGVLNVGVARLARRATVRCTTSTRTVRAAGIIAALVMIAAPSAVQNAGSRYPHTLVAACFAWAVEAMCILSIRGLPNRTQLFWGTALGGTVGLMASTRPGDGVTLGSGFLLYVLYALVRRYMGWRALLTAFVSCALIMGATLVILRLQLGVWFKTGYALTQLFHPWARSAFSIPQPSEFKYGIPAAIGSYCWWPCAPALGIAGLMAIGRPGYRMTFLFTVGSAALLTLCAMTEFGRGVSHGYGPRYQIPTMVPMAVGAGILLGPLWTAASMRWRVRSAFRSGGPAAIALAAALIGVVRIAPFVYPAAHADAHNNSATQRAITKSGLRDAIVLVKWGDIYPQVLDVVQNDPTDKNPDALIGIGGPDNVRCLQTEFPNRKFYSAAGKDEAILTAQ